MKITLLNREDDRLQKPVTKEQLSRICETAFSGSVVTEVRELAGGFFNNTYLVYADGERFILRISPHSSVHMSLYERALMRREYNIQPYFMPLGDCFPKTVFADFTHGICERDYVVQTFVEGTNWEEIKDTLTQKENDGIWYEVGTIAKQICSITSEGFGPPPPAAQFETWGGYLMAYLTGLQRDMKEMGYTYSQVDGFLDLFGNHMELLNTIKTPRLVHGDLWEKNILISQKDGNWRVTGILDSERAYWGDEISEWIHTFIRVSPSYWEGYGELFEPENREIRRLLYRGLDHVMAATECRLRDEKDPKWAMNNLEEIIKELKDWSNR
jgi:aminoglycoside phosphotransferase (APT) family kinase protein